ncbi:MAG: translation initiation factor IF-2, partial [Terriglobales bacterium]
DDRGRGVASAGPSTPVEILGLDGLPEVGDRLLVMNDRPKAKQMTEYREEKDRENTLSRTSRGNLETLSAQIAAGDTKELLLIVKADMQGSAQVLEETLNKLSTEKVKTRIVHTGVGAITETDVLLASASNALIIGFNVKPERKAVELADKEKVEIRLHSIIYELTDEITKAMTGLLAPVFKETVTGRAEVRQTFRIPKGGTIAGSFVRDGRILRDGHVRVLRDGKILHTGRISSIRRFKDDVNEVKNGMECGINVTGFTEFHPGDVLEAFSVEKTYATSLS